MSRPRVLGYPPAVRDFIVKFCARAIEHKTVRSMDTFEDRPIFVPIPAK